MSGINNYDGPNSVIIYNDEKPDVYVYESLYDPDEPESGKVVPSINSLIVKNNTELWVVTDVDPSTHKSSLKPIHIAVDITSESDVTVISWGNDKFALYQDERNDPHKLTVDAKFMLFGNNLVEYSLYREDADGNEECISKLIDTSGDIISDRIPMRSAQGDYIAFKWPSNCHSKVKLTEGQPIILRVFNNLGNIASEITLFVRDATWYNDLTAHVTPIVGIDATANQMIGEDFFLYAQQDTSHLNIQPYLIYADGTRRDINVDNAVCFIYGLDDFMPSYPGYSQTIVIKYFLNFKEATTLSTSDEGTSAISVSKRIVVVRNKQKHLTKLSTVPLYDVNLAEWRLKFFAYSDIRNQVHDVTHLVKFSQGFGLSTDAVDYGRLQKLELEYDLQSIYFTDDPIPNTQSLRLILRDPNEYEKYVYKDNDTSKLVYGADNSYTRRPIIHYDKDIDKYFIPSSVFMNWDSVVESFYYNAQPLFDTTIESTPPYPEYFTIRTATTGAMIIATPIPANEFKQAWALISSAESILGTTVIVEFLRMINNEYQILYGVPVDVVASPTAYIGQDTPT